VKRARKRLFVHRKVYKISSYRITDAEFNVVNWWRQNNLPGDAWVRGGIFYTRNLDAITMFRLKWL
jgi:hypothetical protein